MKYAKLPEVPDSSDRFRLINGTIFDGISDEPIENGEIEVQDGRITYVGMKRPGIHNVDVRTIDIQGGYLTPGFIDLHIHAVMPNDISSETIQWWFPEEEAFATAESLRLTVQAGVTTARDLSGLTPGYRNAISQGLIDGPRMHLAISMLSPTGGHADPLAPNGALPVYAQRATTPGWAVVDTSQEITKTVRRLNQMGADVIKVCTSGGLSTKFDNPTEIGISRSQIAQISELCNKLRHQPIAAHAQSTVGISEAVYGGASTIEHAYGLNDELIEEILKRDITLVPTLVTLHQKFKTDDSSEYRKMRMQRRKFGMSSIAKAIAAGVTIAVGTDSGITRHGNNLEELGYLVDAGMTPLQAIHSATYNGAKAMGLQDEIGTLENGKCADMVLSQCDPMKDIRAFCENNNIRVVWQGGRVVKDLDQITENHVVGKH